MRRRWDGDLWRQEVVVVEVVEVDPVTALAASPAAALCGALLVPTGVVAVVVSRSPKDGVDP